MACTDDGIRIFGDGIWKSCGKGLGDGFVKKMLDVFMMRAEFWIWICIYGRLDHGVNASHPHLA